MGNNTGFTPELTAFKKGGRRRKVPKRSHRRRQRRASPHRFPLSSTPQCRPQWSTRRDVALSVASPDPASGHRCRRGKSSQEDSLCLLPPCHGVMSTVVVSGMHSSPIAVVNEFNACDSSTEVVWSVWSSLANITSACVIDGLEVRKCLL